MYFQIRFSLFYCIKELIICTLVEIKNVLQVTSTDVICVSTVKTGVY